MKKRNVEIVIISDVHLGTYGCHASELCSYLSSIQPGMLVLNGDIVDVWQFRKRYWPEDHMQVLKKIIGFMAEGVPVYYLTGNHDDMLRRFSDFELGPFKLLDKMVFDIQGEKAWVFHGDVFDVSMKHSRWLAKLGGKGYDLLILLNRVINYWLIKLGHEQISLSRKIKSSVKSAVNYIGNFEQTAAEIAIENGYSFVICGHIHKPEIKEICTPKGKVTYLNSGDWVESLTALEYNGRAWSIYEHSQGNNRIRTPRVRTAPIPQKVELSFGSILGEEFGVVI
jgi:UDP-2,3-diacylglucosamine pyrophosphatase LpxH